MTSRPSNSAVFAERSKQDVRELIHDLSYFVEDAEAAPEAARLGLSVPVLAKTGRAVAAISVGISEFIKLNTNKAEAINYLATVIASATQHGLGSGGSRN